MRKTPRLASLLLGLAVVVLAIWRLTTCSAAPPPPGAPVDDSSTG